MFSFWLRGTFDFTNWQISDLILNPHSALNPDSFTFLDILGVRGEATYVTTSDLQVEDIEHCVEGARIVSIDQLLGRYVSKRCIDESFGRASSLSMTFQL